MTGIPRGYNLYTCSVCGEGRWFVATGSFDNQLAICCADCDHIVHVLTEKEDSLILQEE